MVKYAFAPKCLVIFMLLLSSGFATQPGMTATATQDERPNILIIMTDDQRYDSFTEQFMPHTWRMIAEEGIRFTRGYLSTSLCCPSRASFLTGKYARNNGVRNNTDQLTEPTFVNRLHDAGYYTGLAGKYLNSWPGEPRPEFDFWACWLKEDFDPMMNVSGQVKQVPGYLTHILRDYTLEFFDKVPSGKPFFMLVAMHAPHKPASPAPGDENLYSDLPLWRPPNFNPAEQPGKPKWLRDLEPMTEEEIAREVDEFRLRQLRSLKGVDNAVRDLLNRLDEQGKLDNTLVVFLSDNGIMWGEHRLNHKNYVYEESSRGPFAIRYAPLIQTPRVESRLIQMIDIAPTIYELAGIAVPEDVDGLSLLPLMRGTSEWRDAILLEGWSELEDVATAGSEGRRRQAAHYQAIRTARFVYVETDNDKSELYDTNADPYQMNNLVDNPQYKKTVRYLRKRLRAGRF